MASLYWDRVRDYAGYFGISVSQARREAGFKMWYREVKATTDEFKRTGSQSDYESLYSLYDEIGLDFDDYVDDGDTP